jgi:hypothetical protein
MIKSILYVLCITVILGNNYKAHAAPGVDEYFPEDADPFVGDWKGRWSHHETVDPDIYAQVVALGRDEYQVSFVAKLDMRAPKKAFGVATKKGKTLRFEENGIWAEFKGNKVKGGRKNGAATFELKKITRLSPNLGLQPPAGAVVLFDGTSLDGWTDLKGWEIAGDAVLMVTPKGGNIKSKQHFKSVRLHMEFRTSSMPKARGQQRGNSGVFLQDTYEVQILDSYGLEGVYDECGALYKVAAPMVNAAAPPLQWQSYDITYHAPKFKSDGSVAAYPTMTVYHNGVLIHKKQELGWRTGWKEKDRLKPPPNKAMPIRLQGHNNYAQFRNIWLQELEN